MLPKCQKHWLSLSPSLSSVFPVWYILAESWRRNVKLNPTAYCPNSPCCDSNNEQQFRKCITCRRSYRQLDNICTNGTKNSARCIYTENIKSESSNKLKPIEALISSLQALQKTFFIVNFIIRLLSYLCHPPSGSTGTQEEKAPQRLFTSKRHM